MTATTIPSLKLNDGVEMPALGLGVFQTPPDETRDAVRRALARPRLPAYRHRGGIRQRAPGRRSRTQLRTRPVGALSGDQGLDQRIRIRRDAPRVREERAKARGRADRSADPAPGTAGESEEIVGNALKGRRDDVVLATKFFMPMGEDPNMRGGSRRWIVRAVEDSLRRLGTDYIDLYQVHRPEPGVDMDETLGALSDLVHQGKVRYIGSSS
jgi:Aldo/keto reductase family